MSSAVQAAWVTAQVSVQKFCCSYTHSPKRQRSLSMSALKREVDLATCALPNGELNGATLTGGCSDFGWL